MLLHGQVSIAVCGPDISLPNQCVKVIFSQTVDHHYGREVGLAALPQRLVRDDGVTYDWQFTHLGLERCVLDE